MHGAAANSADTFLPQIKEDVQSRYQAVSQNSRYGHYVRIPERICRCLDYFKIPSSRAVIRERLHSYYLFIGVMDDVIDSNQLEAGREILKQLDNRQPVFSEDTKESRVRLVTEVFKCHISRESYPIILGTLEELYEAVVRERTCATMRAYIKQRKTIGRLTAEVSYLLIRPLLTGEHHGLRHLMQRVGEVGCLIDSAIDLKMDVQLGLINFTPTLKDRINLACQLLRDGFGILLRHARLLGVFLEALTDDLLDCRCRAN